MVFKEKNKILSRALCAVTVAVYCHGAVERCSTLLNFLNVNFPITENKIHLDNELVLRAAFKPSRPRKTPLGLTRFQKRSGFSHPLEVPSPLLRSRNTQEVKTKLVASAKSAH